jgi:hypothetical protein
MATTRTYTSWLNDFEYEIRETSRMVQELKLGLFHAEQKLLMLEAVVENLKEVIKE